jgi:5-methylcytosine-specific restriction enzyme A
MPLKMCSGVDGERCGALVRPARDDRGRCPKCRAKNDKNRYDSRRAQGYLTRQWTDVARRFLAAFPVCVDCGARAVIAHHLHGLRPHSPGGMDPANLVPLCRSCHAKRHASRAAGGCS